MCVRVSSAFAKVPRRSSQGGQSRQHAKFADFFPFASVQMLTLVVCGCVQDDRGEISSQSWCW